MIADSKDILYLVLAFCVLWFTIFVCWLLYYFIAIMRDTRGMVKDVRDKIKKIDEAVRVVREKVEKSLSVFSVLADGFKYALKFLGEGGYFRHKASPKKKDKKTKKEKGMEEAVEEIYEGESEKEE